MNDCSVLAYVKDLTLLLKFVWTIYRPCGIVLNEYEISEIVDDFEQWSNQNRHPSKLKGNNESEYCISLNSFHHWFIKINYEYLRPYLLQYIEEGIITNEDYQAFILKLEMNSSNNNHIQSAEYVLKNDIIGDDQKWRVRNPFSRNGHLENIQILDKKNNQNNQKSKIISPIRLGGGSEVDDYADFNKVSMNANEGLLRGGSWFDEGPEVKMPDGIMTDKTKERKKSSSNKRVTFVDTLPQSNDDVFDDRYLPLPSSLDDRYLPLPSSFDDRYLPLSSSFDDRRLPLSSSFDDRRLPLPSSFDQNNNFIPSTYYPSTKANNYNQYVTSSNVWNSRYPTSLPNVNAMDRFLSSSSSSPSSSFDYRAPKHLRSSTLNMTYDAYPPPPQSFNYNSDGYRYTNTSSYQPSSSTQASINSSSIVKEIVESIEGNLTKPNIPNTSNRGFHVNTTRQDTQSLRDINMIQRSSSNERTFKFISRGNDYS